MGNIGGDRPLRVCDLCGGVDDHPRHVIGGYEITTFEPPSDAIVGKVLDTAPVEHRARLLRELQDTSSQDRHLDCCREYGCPLPVDHPSHCANRTLGAERKRGKSLLTHLEQGV